MFACDRLRKTTERHSSRKSELRTRWVYGPGVNAPSAAPAARSVAPSATPFTVFEVTALTCAARFMKQRDQKQKVRSARTILLFDHVFTIIIKLVKL